MMGDFASALRKQGCQMVYFQTKKRDLGNFEGAMEWKMSVYFTTIWNIIRAFVLHIHGRLL
jgi:hypothetical protein